MDAYSTSNWAPVFAAIAGASAALTGLLFVALSINLGKVIAGQGLIGRAVEVLVLLTSVLIVSTLLLMPDQPRDGAAAEILPMGILVAGLLTYIHVRAPRRALGVSPPMFAVMVAEAQSGPIF